MESVTNYNRTELNKLSLDSLKEIFAGLPRGAAISVRSWDIRITRCYTLLVSYYQLKGDDGAWTDHEHRMTL